MDDKKTEGDLVTQVAFGEFACPWWVAVHPDRRFRFEHEPHSALQASERKLRILVW